MQRMKVHLGRCFCIIQINFSLLFQELTGMRKESVGHLSCIYFLAIVKQIIRKIVINRVDPIYFPEACKNLV